MQVNQAKRVHHQKVTRETEIPAWRAALDDANERLREQRNVAITKLQKVYGVSRKEAEDVIDEYLHLIK